MANQLKLSNSVDIFFGKSSNSAFNYCSVNLLLEEIEHDEQLPVLQVISREQGSLGEVIAALYVITGNDQVSHFKSVGIIISSYKHLTLTGISYNASRLLNENIKKITKITLNYQQLSNEFGDNNWLVPKKVARWTAYVAVTWKRKESAKVNQILSIVAFTKLTYW